MKPSLKQKQFDVENGIQLADYSTGGYERMLGFHPGLF
jgi:hypothetical protein